MALYAAGVVKDAAEKIDHRLPPAQPVPEGVSVEHGAYVANMCMGCHGAQLAGGPVPGSPPDWPAAANLTGGLAGYPSADDFVAMMRTGQRPDGTAVSAVMPFSSLREMSDVDLRALYVYLQSLPPVNTP
jgi:cytochrome c553